MRDHRSIPTIAPQSCSTAPLSPPPHHPPILFAAVQALWVPASLPLERYGYGGYLIKVVVMALAGEVTRELSPILAWSNNNYEI